MLSETKPFLQEAIFLAEQLKDGGVTELSLPKVLPRLFPDTSITSTFCQGGSRDISVL